MSGSGRKLVLVTGFSILRFLRQPAVTVIMVGIPLVLIPIMGSVFSKIGNWEAHMDGTTDTMAFFSIGMVVMFQLFGGRFSMDGTRELLITEKRWRIYAAPCSPAIHAMGIVIASALISTLIASSCLPAMEYDSPILLSMLPLLGFNSSAA